MASTSWPRLEGEAVSEPAPAAIPAVMILPMPAALTFAPPAGGEV
jgi:hypothetical protein